MVEVEESDNPKLGYGTIVRYRIEGESDTEKYTMEGISRVFHYDNLNKTYQLENYMLAYRKELVPLKIKRITDDKIIS